jgi:hypothetical protein
VRKENIMDNDETFKKQETQAEAKPGIEALPEAVKPPESQEVEVALPGQPPTKVTVTPVNVAQDGKEATVKVSVSEGEPAEQAPKLAPLLFVAAVAALVLVTSRSAPPPAQ